MEELNARESEYSDDESDDSTWNDGLTEDEIQSVIGFLRNVAADYEENGEEGTETDGVDDGVDDKSNSSMTTTAPSLVSTDTNGDNNEQIHSQHEDEEQNQSKFLFYFEKKQ